MAKVESHIARLFNACDFQGKQVQTKKGIKVSGDGIIDAKEFKSALMFIYNSLPDVSGNNDLLQNWLNSCIPTETIDTKEKFQQFIISAFKKLEVWK